MRLKRTAIHFINEQDFRVLCFIHGKAAGVVMFVSFLDSVVSAGEDQFHDVGCESGFVEQVGERSPGPFGGADGFVQPRLADGAGRKSGTTVAGALESDGQSAARSAAKILETE